MKFEFTVNLKTAKQIGMTIPPNVLVKSGLGDQIKVIGEEVTGVRFRQKR